MTEQYNPHWIVGCGTGRCGSASLVELLNRQPGITVSQEIYGPFAYEDARRARKLNGKMCAASYNGDIAPQWIWHADYWLKRELDIFRMICLKRSKEATVSSFMRWTDPHGFNHLQERGTANPWDQAFPVYQAATKREAIAGYWDHYYMRARRLQQRHPEHFRIFDSPKCLNDPAYQREMLEFAGLTGPEIHTDIHLNKAPIQAEEPHE